MTSTPFKQSKIVKEQLKTSFLLDLDYQKFIQMNQKRHLWKVLCKLMVGN